MLCSFKNCINHQKDGCKRFYSNLHVVCKMLILSIFELKLNFYKHYFLLRRILQPHLPVGLPCYDLRLVGNREFVAALDEIVRQNHFRPYLLPTFDGQCVQGPGTYSPPYS
jgi:hypothetical protein